jgi:hypothetical protein
MVCFTGSTIQYSGTPYAGEHLHLPSAVRRLGRRGQDLDTQVWRVPNRPIEIDQVRSGRPEEEDVRLYDVVLRKLEAQRVVAIGANLAPVPEPGFPLLAGRAECPETARPTVTLAARHPRPPDRPLPAPL